MLTATNKTIRDIIDKMHFEICAYNDYIGKISNPIDFMRDFALDVATIANMDQNETVYWAFNEFLSVVGGFSDVMETNPQNLYRIEKNMYGLYDCTDLHDICEAMHPELL